MPHCVGQFLPVVRFLTGGIVRDYGLLSATAAAETGRPFGPKAAATVCVASAISLRIGLKSWQKTKNVKEGYRVSRIR
jgi:hypothetical protein